MISSALLAVLVVAPIKFHAPLEEQTNAYKLRERISTSAFGSVEMTGVEKRHIGAPQKGRRTVDITFEVQITGKNYKSSGSEKWAQEELLGLREPDHGFLDDQDKLTESDGVSVDAYPIFPTAAIEVGGGWQFTISGQRCLYTLEKVDGNKATITTESSMKSGRGSLKRKGSWVVEISSGKLLSWDLHSEVTYPGGQKETVDSDGELK